MQDLYRRARAPTIPVCRVREGGTLQLDDHLKRLLRELGHAINDTVSESDRISEAISGVRAAGYDIVLKLDATIGLARREPSAGQITSNDRRFLNRYTFRWIRMCLTKTNTRRNSRSRPRICAF